MRTRILILVVSLFVCGNALAQSDTTILGNTMLAMDLALQRKDSVLLKVVLHDKLVYGHSNGWRESKRELIDHLFDGTVTYKYINEFEPSYVFEGNIACVRTNPDVNVLMNGKLIELKLHVLTVWIKTDRGWRLLSRQSIRIN